MKRVSLKCGDCLVVMKQIPDGSVDMILCDLPYGTTACKWDVIIPFEPLWEQYKRVIKRNGAVVLTASQPFTSALVMSNPKWFRQDLIWRKNVASNFLNANFQHLKRHEEVLLFCNGKPNFNKQKSSGKPYYCHRKGQDDTGEVYGAIRQRLDTLNTGDRNPISVLDFDREVGLHPTQKPVALMEYLINTYTEPGDTVMDNCMGSGTTGVAAVRTGRKFIGFEKEPKYYTPAVERIKTALKEVRA